MAMYRRVDYDIWSDPKFRELSAPEPSAQVLWIHLLIGKHTSIIPGVLIASPMEVVAALGWATMEHAARAMDVFCEITDRGMAIADDRAGLIWLPNALKRNLPASPNHVRHWRSTWARVPSCALKAQIHQHFYRVLEAYRKGYGKAFRKACPEVSTEGYSQGYRESVSSKQVTEIHPTGGGVPVPVPPPPPPQQQPLLAAVAEPPPPPPKPPPPKRPRKPSGAHQEFIDGFDRLFAARRGERPAWGGKEAAHVKTLLKRTGGDHERALARAVRMFDIAPRFPAEHPDLATLVAHWDKFAPPVSAAAVGRTDASSDPDDYGPGGKDPTF